MTQKEKKVTTIRIRHTHVINKMLKKGLNCFEECIAGIFKRGKRKKSKVSAPSSIEFTTYVRKDPSWRRQTHLRIQCATRIQRLWRRYLNRKRCRANISEHYRLAGVERALANKYDFDIIWCPKTARRRWSRRKSVGSRSRPLGGEESGYVSEQSGSSGVSPNNLPGFNSSSKGVYDGIATDSKMTPFICSICLDRGHSSMTSPIQVMTRCNHRFHYNCVEEYMSFKRNERPKCPYCRQDIRLKSPWLNWLNKLKFAPPSP